MNAQLDITITQQEIFALIVIRHAIVALEISLVSAKVAITVIYFKFRVQPVRKVVYLVNIQNKVSAINVKVIAKHVQVVLFVNLVQQVFILTKIHVTKVAHNKHTQIYKEYAKPVIQPVHTAQVHQIHNVSRVFKVYL